MSTFIIGYDVKSAKRLRRIRRFMAGRAVALQLSVFLFEGTKEACLRCINEACRLLDLKNDDLRCYQLPLNCSHLRLGAATLPEGLYWQDSASICS